jgi:hypothetical protein
MGVLIGVGWTLNPMKGFWTQRHKDVEKMRSCEDRSRHWSQQLQVKESPGLEPGKERISGLQKCERVNFCILTSAVCGNLLQSRKIMC